MKSSEKFPLVNKVRVLDIGARSGPQYPWKDWADHCTPILFEPETEEYARLKQRHEHVFNVALGDAIGERLLHITRGPGKSSLYEPNIEFLKQFPKHERFDVVSTQTVSTTTLDVLYKEGRLPGADAIKIDVQGAELDILKGGAELLRDHVLSLQIEISFDELYKGYPHFCEIDSFMRSIGAIHLHDLSKRHWRYAAGKGLDAKGRLVFGDALYFSDIDRIMQMQNPEEKLLSAAFIAMLYGFPDFGLHLLRESGIDSDGVRGAIGFINRICRRPFTIPISPMKNALRLLMSFFPRDGKDGSVGATRRFGRLQW